MSDVIISIKNMGVTYRKRRAMFRHEYFEALKDISFDVHRGETLGIVGRNGAGKSTLLKVLSGIFLPDRGSIENHSKRTSLLSLSAGFDGNLSGRDNAIISGMLLGHEKSHVIEALPDIEAYCDLGEFFHEPIKTYSSGMKARLGFAVATYARPEVLLIDEVLGVGDVKFKEKASKTMRDMIQSDQTVVLVSHSAGVMAELCDRIVWIEHGTIRADGLPEEVLEQYKQAAKSNQDA